MVMYVHMVGGRLCVIVWDDGALRGGVEEWLRIGVEVGNMD